MGRILSSDPNAGDPIPSDSPILSTDPAAGQKTLLGGTTASLDQGGSESLWDKAREAVSLAIFGHPDRAKARAAGIGLQPTPADMAESFGTGAGLLAGAGMVAEAPLAASAIGRGAIASLPTVAPTTAATVGSGLGSWAGGKIAGRPGAIIGGLVGGLGSGSLAARARAASSVAGAETAAAATPAVEAATVAAESAPSAVVAGTGQVGPYIPGAERMLGSTKYVWGPQGGWFKAPAQAAEGAWYPGTLGTHYAGKPLEVAAQAAEAAPAVAQAAEAVPIAAKAAQAVSGATSEAERARVMFKAVKEAAGAGQKFEGAKIWFKLENGVPTKIITPGQASALSEDAKTWIGNLWGKGSRP